MLTAAARRDPLTGLDNRLRFCEALQERMGRDRRGSLGVALIEIDGLRDLNRSLGFAAGDLVLVEVANRLKSMHAGPVVARVGARRFAVITRTADPASLEAVVQRCITAMRFRMGPTAGEWEVHPTIAVTEVDTAGTVDDALHRAEAALHRARDERHAST